MRPGIHVIVSSGQDAERGMQKLGDPRVAAYLQKPYAPEILIAAVQQTLGKERVARTESG
jgi:DNA-binding NarL/FixJ family response regulator